MEPRNAPGVYVMPKTFKTGQISDVDINQIVITVGKDISGNPEVRVRCNVSVVLSNTLDPLDTTTLNIPVNQTIQQLGIGPQVVAIRNAILTFARTQI
jgi:hypothetical protein